MVNSARIYMKLLRVRESKSNTSGYYIVYEIVQGTRIYM